ncbi:MAG TPA: TIGR03435 family protein [Bryobacteraceae bacterium]|nr:TIGR03435 family protein [Bryobacteraceae bacterium]
MRRSVSELAVIGVIAATPLLAQTPPRVEVASIRVHSPKSGHPAGPPIAGNRLTVGGNLKQLVIYAYDLKTYQVSGGPDWVTNPSLETDYYDIVAKAEGDSALTQQQARLLVQSLLADRFQLRVHRERREMPVYVLAIGKGGPKFKESGSDATCRSRGRVSAATVTSTFTACPMDYVVRVLSGAADRPVIDQTGLRGVYDLQLEFARDPAAATVESNSASLFTAVQELGLKLESQKSSIEVVVIDRAERPSEN